MRKTSQCLHYRKRQTKTILNIFVNMYKEKGKLKIMNAFPSEKATHVDMAGTINQVVRST